MTPNNLVARLNGSTQLRPGDLVSGLVASLMGDGGTVDPPDDGPCIVCPSIPATFLVRWYFYGFGGSPTPIAVYESTASYQTTSSGVCYWTIAETPETGSSGVIQVSPESGQIRFYVEWGSGFTGFVDLPGCPTSTGTVTVPGEIEPSYVELIFEEPGEEEPEDPVEEEPEEPSEPEGAE